ncbi:DUF4129 domain-containing protein [Flindersiella endophytica]
MDRRWSTRQLGLALAVPTLLLLVIVASVLSGPEVTQIPMPAGERSAPPITPAPGTETPLLPTMSPFANSGATSPEWLGVLVKLLAGVLAVLAVVVAGLLIWKYAPRLRLAFRRPDTSESEADAPADAGVAGSEQAVRSAVDTGIGELDDESADPRRAVIACWLRLEAAATSAGVEHPPQDAPADLVTRLLEHYDVSRPLLLGFADLYRQARYAPADVDDAMRVQARETLVRLRAELSRTPSSPAEAS